VLHRAMHGPWGASLAHIPPTHPGPPPNWDGNWQVLTFTDLNRGQLNTSAFGTPLALFG